MGSIIDMTGQRFGELEVLKRDISKTGGAAYWICKCSCGKIISTRGQFLRDGSKTNCGCIKKTRFDTTSMVGKTFGRLKVLERDISKPHGRGHEAYWICQCECGNKKSVSTKSLNCGSTKSCGCLRSELVKAKNTLDLTGQRFGHLIALENTMKLSNHNSYIWKCQCDCGKIHFSTAEILRSGKINSCGCQQKSLGEEKIENILKENNISYKTEYTFEDLRNPDTNRLFRYDFAIFNNKKLIRLIEFDGEQHFKEKDGLFFNYEQIKKSDYIKNKYAIDNNIPLVRVPYYELKNISLSLLLSDEYLVKEN